MNKFKRFGRGLAGARRAASAVKGSATRLGKGVLAGLAAAGVLAANAGSSVLNKAEGISQQVLHPNHKKSGEVIQVKKSTFVALLVALAAVAGVLGALYFYVLRRERELDEYEQLLFSEDFNDDLLDDEDDLPEATEE